MIGTIHRLVNKNIENEHKCGLIDPIRKTKGQGSAIIIKIFKLLLSDKICIFTHGTLQCRNFKVAILGKSSPASDILFLPDKSDI